MLRYGTLTFFDRYCTRIISITQYCSTGYIMGSSGKNDTLIIPRAIEGGVAAEVM